MTMKKHLITVVAAIGLSTVIGLCQQGAGQVRQPRQQQAVQQRVPRSPIIAVLDANGDGIIDENEIANAVNALKKLDKNGDGKLTPDEYLPQRIGAAVGGTLGPQRSQGVVQGRGRGQIRAGQRE